MEQRIEQRHFNDDPSDERDIWEVIHVTEEDFENPEGETEDLYDKLMEMTRWTVTDKEKDKDLT